jgi:hypothetical protein
MFKHFEGSHLVVWIKVQCDPHARPRGFSILGKELRVIGYEPVQDVQKTLDGYEMPGLFWMVPAREVYRVIPQMRRFGLETKPFFFPNEFCEPFVRPANYLDLPVREIILPPEIIPPPSGS